MQKRRMRVGLGMHLERQIHEGQGQDGKVPDAEFSGEEVGVEIPDEQDGLEEHQASEPHMGRPAEVGSQQPPRQRLEPEEQDCPAKDHARQDDHGQTVISPVLRRVQTHRNCPPKAVIHTAFPHYSSRYFFAGRRLECWVHCTHYSITPWLQRQGCLCVKGITRS